jgi:hypothetical protein
MAMKKAAKRGRPRLENGLKIQLNVRIDESTRKAIEAYRQKFALGEVSDAARHILKRVLRDEGLLNQACQEPAGS